MLGDWTRLGIGRGFVAENFRDVCGSEGLTETVTVPPATWKLGSKKVGDFFKFDEQIPSKSGSV